jgi:hypothetical protein
VEIGPFGYELERPAREVPDQYNAAADRDHGVVLGILSVEVRRVVVVEVHRDRDAIEQADARHRAIMSTNADGRVRPHRQSTELRTVADTR